MPALTANAVAFAVALLCLAVPGRSLDWRDNLVADCSFNTADSGTKLTHTAELCSAECFNSTGCTHFSWKPAEDSASPGTCHLKAGCVSKSSAVVSTNSTCGIVPSGVACAAQMQRGSTGAASCARSGPLTHLAWGCALIFSLL